MIVLALIIYIVGFFVTWLFTGRALFGLVWPLFWGWTLLMVIFSGGPDNYIGGDSL